MKRVLATSLVWILAGSATYALPVLVTAGGTAFEGGPAFEMRLGDRVIGAGQVPDPIPPDGELFSFDVDDALFADSADISLVLSNDRWKKDEGDRNLRIIKVQIGGLELLPADFMVQNGEEPATVFDGALNSVSEVARISAPEGGWLAAAAAPASDAPAEPVAETKPAAADPATPEKAAEPATATAPVGDAPAAVTATPAVAETPAPVRPDCDAGISIGGFSNNVVALTDSQRDTLDDALSSLTDCALVVTGYSSLSGSDPVNQRISAARAQAVADYLDAADAPPASVNVVGAGSTDQFGAAPADNRVVVIEVAK